jgi:hypothetical protein
MAVEISPTAMFSYKDKTSRVPHAVSRLTPELITDVTQQ